MPSLSFPADYPAEVLPKVVNHLLQEPSINSLLTVEGTVTDTDYYRCVAAVEEANAVFEGWLLRDLPGKPKFLHGYPVLYSDAVVEGEVFGGMWSDAVLEWGGFVPKHPAAFVHLRPKP